MAAVMKLKIHLRALGENTSSRNPERQALRLATFLKLHPMVAPLSSSQLAKRSAQAGTHQTSATCITSGTGSDFLSTAARSPKQPSFAAPRFQIKPLGSSQPALAQLPSARYEDSWNFRAAPRS